jgi:hypothetical protein
LGAQQRLTGRLAHEEPLPVLLIIACRNAKKLLFVIGNGRRIKKTFQIHFMYVPFHRLINEFEVMCATRFHVCIPCRNKCRRALPPTRRRHP